MSHVPGKAPVVLEALESRRLLADSAWVYPSIDGDSLIYHPTATGDRIMDFSRVGYRDNLAPIPEVPAKVVVKPARGNDRRRIQSAIHQVSAMPIDPMTGFRGAVELSPGTFQLRGSLKINTSGVVLRGAGDGRKGTRLLATWRGDSPLIDVNFDGRFDRPQRRDPRPITDKYVPAGARTFRVETVQGLDVGDRIVVKRPSPAEWLRALGMDRLELPWLPGTKDIEVERTITRIEGNKITIDDPLTHSLDRRFGGGVIHEGSLVRRIHNVGIEDLRGDSRFAAQSDVDHAWWFVQFHATENAWLRRVTAEHFVQGVFTAEFGSRSITVQDTVSRDPVSPIVGNMRYPFNLEPGAEKILVRDVLSLDGRHDFVTDGGGVHGPNVFVNAVARGSHADSGPHMHYATGLLFDNVRTDDELNVRNRGDKGTNHGWAGANNVVWNSVARNGFRVRNPPGAQNWLIGGRGDVNSHWRPPSRQPLPNDRGYYDSVGRMVTPRSLYHAQFKIREAHPDAEDREYTIGDIDDYANDAGHDDRVHIDPEWRDAVEKRSGSRAGSFDDVASEKRWVPFTLAFDLEPGERVAGASLSLGLWRTRKNPEKDRIYFDSFTSGGILRSLHRRRDARVFDLTEWLTHLQDGQLNVAVQDGVAIDWAILHIRVARAVSAHPVPTSENAHARHVLDESAEAIYDSPSGRAPP